MTHATQRVFSFVLCAFFVFKKVYYCDGQFLSYRNDQSFLPVPFPTCIAEDIDCLRRGLRTFFILMDSNHLGMKPVDPLIINSVAISYEDQQTSFLLRRVNVTGARWSKLIERRINVGERRNSAIFSSDLHITGDLFMSTPDRLEPIVAYLTMDIYAVESNISYSWSFERGIDNEDYLLMGPERVAVRNTRIPSFYLQPKSQDVNILEQALIIKPTVLEHLSNEITTSLIHSIIDNFRLFSSRVPVKYYYKYK
ncbi:hypothetical protein K1T71_001204 [Dendrolimus kikuchii]|uniref:Uncharacterized protein n=1 Tax=Dendrolimus kikuchii TaxID=765133 RepID=A0ACC1DGY1_9NEOP|nr:hypothetical protein K1T71_001204 [Dendrolimus kikuchii]